MINKSNLPFRSEIVKIVEHMADLIKAGHSGALLKLREIVDEYEEATQVEKKKVEEKREEEGNLFVTKTLEQLLATRSNPTIVVAFYDPRGNACRETRFPMPIKIDQKVTYGNGIVGIVRAFQGYKCELVCINSEDNMQCAIVPRSTVHCANPTLEQAVSIVISANPGAVIYNMFIPNA